MKSIVLEKHELANRDESMSQTISAPVIHQDCKAVIELIAFLAEIPLKVKSFHCNFGGRSEA